MSKELQVFNFKGNDVRITSKDGVEWFIASDIAKALGHNNVSEMCKMADDRYITTILCDSGNSDITSRARKTQKLLSIAEPGVWQVLTRMRVRKKGKVETQKEKAKRELIEVIQIWLYEEVLPTIRKTGSYSIPQTDDEIIAIGYGKAIQKIELLENKVKEDEPKVKAYNKFIEKGESLSLKTCAKEIFGSILGRNNMMGILRSENILLIDNEPAQDYMKYFEVKSTKCKDGRFRSQTFVKPSSMIYLEERVLKHLKKIEDSKPLPVRGKLKSQT